MRRACARTSAASGSPGLFDTKLLTRGRGRSISTYATLFSNCTYLYCDKMSAEIQFRIVQILKCLQHSEHTLTFGNCLGFPATPAKFHDCFGVMFTKFNQNPGNNSIQRNSSRANLSPCTRRAPIYLREGERE